MLRQLNRNWFSIIILAPFVAVIIGLIVLSRSDAPDLMAVARPLPDGIIPSGSPFNLPPEWRTDGQVLVSGASELCWLDVDTNKLDRTGFGYSDVTRVSPDGDFVAERILSGSLPSMLPGDELIIYRKGCITPCRRWSIDGTIVNLQWLPDSKRLLVITINGGVVQLDSESGAKIDANFTFWDNVDQIGLRADGSIISPAFNQFVPSPSSNPVDMTLSVAPKGVMFWAQTPGARAPTWFWVKPPPQSGDRCVACVSADGGHVLWHFSTDQRSPLAPTHLVTTPDKEVDDFWISNIDGSDMRKLWTTRGHDIEAAYLSPTGTRALIQVDNNWYAAPVDK